jgi:hypothetical protein
MFVTVFTTTHQWFLFSARCMQSTPYFPKIHSKIIFSSMPRSSEWSLSFGYSNQNIVSISDLYSSIHLYHFSKCWRLSSGCTRHSLHGCGILFEKLTVPQLVKRILLLYGTRRFITVFTKARHWTLSWASRIQFAPTIPTSGTYLYHYPCSKSRRRTPIWGMHIFLNPFLPMFPRPQWKRDSIYCWN